MRPLLFMLAISTSAVAAPTIDNVTGQVSQNGILTINGSNFGSHALDIEWTGDNIEEGEPGTPFARDRWSNGWSFQKAKYDTERSHSGKQSLKCVPLPKTSWNCPYSYELVNPTTAAQVMYVTWWTSFDDTATSGQWKIVRLSGKRTVVDGYQQMAMFNHVNKQYILTFNPGMKVSQTFWPGKNVFPQPDRKWYRMEFRVRASNDEQSNGIVNISRYGNNAVHHAQVTQVMTHARPGDTYSHVIFQNYQGNGMKSTPIWSDDIYIQKGTVARVELCDNAVWNSRKHCEIQMPTDWSTGRVSVKAQPGAYTSGDTAYLFVVDSAGQASNSIAVTIGEDSSVVVPMTAPHSIQIEGN